MQELPLFPLNTVLFPGTPLRLHIFEERYKRMINQCVDEQEPFGVVLIRHGAEALGPLPEPFWVGTLANIIQVQRLPDGRMNIVAVGKSRFRIISLEPDLQPYLVGYIEPFPLITLNPVYLQEKGDKLRQWVEHYLHTMSDAGAGQFDISQFPNNPIDLAYMAASLLQLSNLQKQELLTIERAEDLLDQVDRVFRREIALLRAFTAKGPEGYGVFSPN